MGSPQYTPGCNEAHITNSPSRLHSIPWHTEGSPFKDWELYFYLRTVVWGNFFLLSFFLFNFTAWLASSVSALINNAFCHRSLNEVDTSFGHLSQNNFQWSASVNFSQKAVILTWPSLVHPRVQSVTSTSNFVQHNIALNKYCSLYYLFPRKGFVFLSVSVFL